MTTTQASAFQNFTSISGGHALPESMNAQAAMDARLIGTFGHTLSFRSKNHFAKCASANYTLTNPVMGIFGSLFSPFFPLLLASQILLII
jgi:hypothetical protein